MVAVVLVVRLQQVSTVAVVAVELVAAVVVVARSKSAASWFGMMFGEGVVVFCHMVLKKILSKKNLQQSWYYLRFTLGFKKLINHDFLFLPVVSACDCLTWNVGSGGIVGWVVAPVTGVGAVGAVVIGGVDVNASGRGGRAGRGGCCSCGCCCCSCCILKLHINE